MTARARDIVGAVLALVAAGAAPDPHYATTRFLEPDRCATAWVIKRLTHPAATITLHERDDLPREAILFDLPEAELKRDASRATVEVLLDAEHVDDPFARRLGRLVHDIEINAWATRREPGSREFEQRLREAIAAATTPEAALEGCLAVIDRLKAGEGASSAPVK